MAESQSWDGYDANGTQSWDENDESLEYGMEGTDAQNQDGSAPAMNEWQQVYDDDGNLYFYNNYTGVSQYEDPGYGY